MPWFHIPVQNSSGFVKTRIEGRSRAGLALQSPLTVLVVPVLHQVLVHGVGHLGLAVVPLHVHQQMVPLALKNNPGALLTGKPDQSPLSPHWEKPLRSDPKGGRYFSSLCW